MVIEAIVRSEKERTTDDSLTINSEYVASLDTCGLYYHFNQSYGLSSHRLCRGGSA